MPSKYERTIPSPPIICAITAPVSGSEATIASLLNAAQIALITGTVIQLDIQDKSGLGLKVFAPDGAAGAGSWLIAANGEREFAGMLTTFKVSSQTAGTAAAAVIISFATGN